MLRFAVIILTFSGVTCRSVNSGPTNSMVSSAGDVSDYLSQATAGDGILSQDEVQGLFASAGNKIKADEWLGIWRAVRSPTGYTVEPAALAEAERLAFEYNLGSGPLAQMKANKTLAGTPIPEAVQKIIAEARLAGATAFDVRDPDPDDPNEGFWSPYPQGLPASGPMAYSHTEINPTNFSEDLADRKPYKKMSSQIDGKVTYTEGQCETQGKGSIDHNYDEAEHDDLYARGYNCQKWASNCAILIDGSLHCLLAPRRAAKSGNLADLILTNPSLARENHLLFNGHILARNGEIYYVGMSGRIAKKAARNDYAFVDPIPLLRAWGFKVKDGIKTVSEHEETANLLATHPESHTLRGQ